MYKYVYIFSTVQARGWKIQGSWFGSWQGLDIHLFTKNVQTCSGPTQPPMQWVQWGFLLAGKTAGACITPPTSISAKVKDALSYNVTLPNAFRAQFLM